VGLGVGNSTGESVCGVGSDVAPLLSGDGETKGDSANGAGVPPAGAGDTVAAVPGAAVSPPGAAVVPSSGSGDRVGGAVVPVPSTLGLGDTVMPPMGANVAERGCGASVGTSVPGTGTPGTGAGEMLPPESPGFVWRIRLISQRSPSNNVEQSQRKSTLALLLS
jgi:hypothetical protein